MPAEEKLKQHRNRSIRLAVMTSVVSKAGTVLLRLISIPIAIRMLGMEEFGVYATITMVVAMIDMFHVGIGPALTQGIARALAAEDREKETSLFSTALLLSAGMTLLVAAVLVLLILLVPVPVLFGQNYAPFQDSMQRACLLAILILSTEFICVVCDRARDGYMETSYNNAWGAAGNFLGAALLIAGIRVFPTIEFLVLAINGSIAFGKLANAVHLMFQRPHLRPRFAKFRRALIKPLLLDGGKFSVTYLLSALVEYNAVVYLIGRISGPAAAGVFNIMVTIHLSMTGLIQMFTIPLWPALINAHQKRDFDWIRQAAHRLRLVGPAFALAAGTGLVALGPWLLPLWAGREFNPERPMLLAFSVYFLLHIWRQVNQVLALGLERVNEMVSLITLEAMFSLAAVSVALLGGGGLTTVYWLLAAVITCVSGWLSPMVYCREMRKLRSPDPGIPPMAEGSEESSTAV